MPTPDSLSELSINTIRTLSMDAVEEAKSGHPGTPMALAPVVYALWQHVLRYDPQDPLWPGRDRFVLSCGHASMLLYSVLHLAGVRAVDANGLPTSDPAVSLEDIRRFRQLGSHCLGHPERGHTAGVETTTGPLGQGVANSVGMAIAQRWLAAHFGGPGIGLFDYRIFALASDGDMMEGIGSEAASLAGHLQLSNLCWIYDANGITIDGRTELSLSEDVAGRFTAYRWNVVGVEDANDVPALVEALGDAEAETDRPTLIVVHSQIGFGAPKKQGTSEAHGAPLGEEEIKGAKANYGWPTDAKFLVPPEVPAHFREGVGARGAAARRAWQHEFGQYASSHPQKAEAWKQLQAGTLPDDWAADIPRFPADAKGLATRDSSGQVVNAIAARVPWFFGGAADLASSTKTTIKGAGDFAPGKPQGRNLHFGVREHAMAAALNGMALSGLRPYGSTFLVFSDYCRPSIRLSAIMGLNVLYVFTHDSIGVGEDGPTHQPIEHFAALRAIPGLIVLRPADANEVAESYRTILQLCDRPVALLLSRQALPTFDREKYGDAAGTARGAYVLADPPGAAAQAIIIATGSEVTIAVAAHEALLKEGVRTRVVSMPSWELFELQSAEYREQVLPRATTARVGVEMGIEQGWSRYLGPGGAFVGMHGYGASAPWPVLQKHFGFLPEDVAEAVRRQLST